MRMRRYAATPRTCEVRALSVSRDCADSSLALSACSHHAFEFRAIFKVREISDVGTRGYEPLHASTPASPVSTVRSFVKHVLQQRVQYAFRHGGPKSRTREMQAAYGGEECGPGSGHRLRAALVPSHR